MHISRSFVYIYIIHILYFLVQTNHFNLQVSTTNSSIQEILSMNAHGFHKQHHRKNNQLSEATEKVAMQKSWENSLLGEDYLAKSFYKTASLLAAACHAAALLSRPQSSPDAEECYLEPE